MRRRGDLMAVVFCCALSTAAAQDTRARIGLPGFKDTFPIETQTSSFDINASKSKAHAAFKAAFAELDLSLDRDEPSGAVLGVQGLQASHNLAGFRMSRLFDCGSNPMSQNADSFRITVVALVLLDATDATHTVARIGVVGGGEPIGGSRAQAVQCSSTGKLEARLLELATKRLQ